MKIDSSPIEGFEMERTVRTPEEHSGIDPALYQPAVMVAFGYRAEELPFAKTRRDMKQIVTWF